MPSWVGVTVGCGFNSQGVDSHHPPPPHALAVTVHVFLYSTAKHIV